MNKLKVLLEELAATRDELNLQAHLMQMELKDEWQELTKQLDHLEQHLSYGLLELAEKLGHAEEHFYVDDAPEIEKLVDDLRRFKARAKPQ